MIEENEKPILQADNCDLPTAVAPDAGSNVEVELDNPDLLNNLDGQTEF